MFVTRLIFSKFTCAIFVHWRVILTTYKMTCRHLMGNTKSMENMGVGACDCQVKIELYHSSGPMNSIQANSKTTKLMRVKD